MLITINNYGQELAESEGQGSMQLRNLACTLFYAILLTYMLLV